MDKRGILLAPVVDRDRNGRRSPMDAQKIAILTLRKFTKSIFGYTSAVVKIFCLPITCLFVCCSGTQHRKDHHYTPCDWTLQLSEGNMDHPGPVITNFETIKILYYVSAGIPTTKRPSDQGGLAQAIIFSLTLPEWFPVFDRETWRRLWSLAM